jgi:hypothetical protein
MAHRSLIKKLHRLRPASMSAAHSVLGLDALARGNLASNRRPRLVVMYCRLRSARFSLSQSKYSWWHPGLNTYARTSALRMQFWEMQGDFDKMQGGGKR